MYIAIEGLKGTGKSTLLQALALDLKAYCEPRQQRLALFHPTMPIHENHYLEQGFYQHQNNDAYLKLLYAARSNHHASQTDWGADLVISDRSILTSLAVRWKTAHQENISPVEHYEQVRCQEHVIAIPDIVIHLDASNTILLERYAKRGRQYGQHEETLESVIDLKSSYDHLFAWLHNEQTTSLLGKYIPVYKYNTGLVSVQSICQEIIAVIEQNFANINSELSIKKSYSSMY